MTERWAYKVDKINMVAQVLEDTLAARGKEGWELVIAYRDGPFVIAIFKMKALHA